MEDGSGVLKKTQPSVLQNQLRSRLHQETAGDRWIYPAARRGERVGETYQMKKLPIGVSGDLSGCLFSLGARSAAGSSGTSAVGDFAGDVGGVVIGEGEKSGGSGWNVGGRGKFCLLWVRLWWLGGELVVL